MQTNLFSFFAAYCADRTSMDTTPCLAAPVELDLATLEHVGGGVMGPAGTWSAEAVAAGPAGTW